MAARVRCLLASCLLVLAVMQLSHCQRRRVCDCASDGNITYVCLLRCGRGGSGGNVVVMPVKRASLPSTFLATEEKVLSNRWIPREDEDTNAMEYDHRVQRFPLTFLTNAVTELREIFNVNDVILRDQSERVN